MSIRRAIGVAAALGFVFAALPGDAAARGWHGGGYRGGFGVYVGPPVGFYGPRPYGYYGGYGYPYVVPPPVVFAPPPVYYAPPPYVPPVYAPPVYAPGPGYVPPAPAAPRAGYVVPQVNGGATDETMPSKFSSPNGQDGGRKR